MSYNPAAGCLYGKNVSVKPYIAVRCVRLETLNSYAFLLYRYRHISAYYHDGHYTLLLLSSCFVAVCV